MMIMGAEVAMPESPRAKFWTWVVGIVVGTVGGWVFLETQFVRAADGAQMRAEYTAQIAATNATVAKTAAETNLQVEYSADQNAKRAIETKLFELEQIPPKQLKPADRALYQKLQRDRDDLVKLWLQRGRPLR
jgi:hypothetical protein